MSKRVTQQEKQEALENLRRILKPGDTVFGIVRSVSRSGMSRTIDFFAFKAKGDDEPGRKHCGEVDRFYLSGYIASALGYSRDKWGAIKISGCGMDMVHHVVYNVGYALFKDGFGVPCEKCGERPAAIDGCKRLVYASPKGRRCGGLLDGHEFYGRNGDRSGWDADGGYALRAETL